MGVEIGLALAAAAPYLTAASMAIGAGTAVVQYQAGREQAAGQRRANDQMADSALQARNLQVQQIQTRAQQERDAASERLFEGRVKALEGQGTAAATAAGRGIQGNTVDALAREHWASQGRAEEAITRTSNNITGQLAMEQRGVQAAYEGRLQGAAPVREPSLWGLGLGIAQGVAPAARDYIRSETRNPRPNSRE